MKKILSLLFLITIGCSNNQDEMIVNIYSQRHYDVDQLQYDNFEKETGINKVFTLQRKSTGAIEK